MTNLSDALEFVHGRVELVLQPVVETHVLRSTAQLLLEVFELETGEKGKRRRCKSVLPQHDTICT